MFFLMALGVSVGTALIISIGLFIAVSVFIQYHINSAVRNSIKLNDNLKDMLRDYLPTHEYFTPDDIYINGDGNAFISICEPTKELILGKITTSKIPGQESLNASFKCKKIPVGDIISFELCENNVGILSSSGTANTIGMAAVGGLLFGNTGAIVGAIAGSNDKTNTSNIALYMTINSMSEPCVGFVFFQGNLAKTSPFCKPIMDEAKKWYGLINVVKFRINKGGKNDH
ncbi:MAG: hypothetical protein Q8M92_01500 [Candidatus Subteraquimicrobiales bacterium]|nr:hypothetical protein [Candidatus Subteraquimicrobiales bacterium]